MPSWDDYFAGDELDMSRGCIHVKEPAKLPGWMLRKQPEYIFDGVRHAMDATSGNIGVNLTDPLTAPIL